ncbi:spore germination protein GerPC [Paenibacillus sp. KN14-4R]|uniref:spore germination protein GerPC n=1 Tax=Paenibacillus sp. KN14-4R TaxID=3445773 RepID=UPI003FA00866
MQSLFYQQVINYLNWQTDKLLELEQMMKQLQIDVNAIKERSETKIDRIEYKFDQLKIEKLDGTLNIGLTPNVGKSIEDFTVNGQSMEQLKNDDSRSELFIQIHEEVTRHLTEEVPRELELLKNNYQIVLGNHYTEVMIEDIRKQIDERIRFYMGPKRNDMDSNDRHNLRISVVEQMKQDINMAIKQHINQLFRKEE